MMSQTEISADMVKLRACTKQMVEIKEKLKLDRSASNGRRRCRSGTPGDARDAPTEHFRQKDPSKKFYVRGVYSSLFPLFI